MWAPCVAHQMDLLLEDNGKMAFAADLVKRAHEAVKFLTSHQASLAIFREHSMKDLKQAVLSSSWEGWVERDERHVGTAATLCKALDMDDGFFAEAQRLLELVR